MPVPQDSRSPFRQQRWVECRNDSGSSLASFSVVQIIGATKPDGIRSVLLVGAATEDSPQNTAAIGPYDIPDGGYGICTLDFPAWARCDASLAEGEIGGLATSGTTLVPDQSGFIVLGDLHDGIGRVMRACVCVSGCIIVSDDFDVPDTDDPPGWTEVSGDWEIYSYELVESGTPGALILSDNYHTEPSWISVAATGAGGPISGATYRVAANCSSGGLCFYTDMKWESPSTLTVSLYKGSTLLDEKVWTDVGTEVVEEGLSVAIYLTENFAIGMVISSTPGTWLVCYYPETEPIGIYSDQWLLGVGNGGSIAISYDFYVGKETYYTNPDCDLMIPLCCGQRSTPCPYWIWDRTQGFWYGSLRLDMTMPDYPDFHIWADLACIEHPQEWEGCGAYWEGNTEGSIEGALVNMYCLCEGTEQILCYRYLLLTDVRAGALCGITITGHPDSCECDTPYFYWLAYVVNEALDPEDPCYYWYPDGTEVHVEVQCYTSAKEAQEARRARPSRPGMAKLAKRYVGALAKWIAAGRPKRTDAEVDAILAVCKGGCKYYDGGTCRVCGCHLNKSTLAIANKARMATERCPLGKWPKAGLLEGRGDVRPK